MVFDPAASSHRNAELPEVVLVERVRERHTRVDSPLIGDVGVAGQRVGVVVRRRRLLLVGVAEGERVRSVLRDLDVVECQGVAVAGITADAVTAEPPDASDSGLTCAVPASTPSSAS